MEHFLKKKTGETHTEGKEKREKRDRDIQSIE